MIRCNSSFAYGIFDVFSVRTTARMYIGARPCSNWSRYLSSSFEIADISYCALSLCFRSCCATRRNDLFRETSNTTQGLPAICGCRHNVSARHVFADPGRSERRFNLDLVFEVSVFASRGLHGPLNASSRDLNAAIIYNTLGASRTLWRISSTPEVSVQHLQECRLSS
jgi:predicted aminopeptidase